MMAFYRKQATFLFARFPLQRMPLVRAAEWRRS